MLARFTNTSLSSPKSNVGLQAAVPKTQKLQLNAISSADLGPGAEATQSMRVSGSKGVRMLLCLESFHVLLNYLPLEVLRSRDANYLKILASFTIAIENIVYKPFARKHHGSSGLGGTKVV